MHYHCCLQWSLEDHLHADIKSVKITFGAVPFAKDFDAVGGIPTITSTVVIQRGFLRFKFSNKQMLFSPSLLRKFFLSWIASVSVTIISCCFRARIPNPFTSPARPYAAPFRSAYLSDSSNSCSNFWTMPAASSLMAGTSGGRQLATDSWTYKSKHVYFSREQITVKQGPQS